MKILGAKKAAQKLRALPDKQRDHVVRAIRRNAEQGAKVARTLAPNVTGETRARITTAYYDEGMVGEVVAIDSDAPRPEKDKVYSIHYGRKRGERGTTTGYLYMTRTRQYLGKRFRNSIKRAVKKAAREVSDG